eukprot:scaffold162_cov176-Amphora_coffeaeformis.AAC.14
MPPIMDLSLNGDDYEEEEDWDDDDYSLFGAEDPAVLAMRPAWALQDAQEHNRSLEECFAHHEHYLYSCDGNGAYMIASLWNAANDSSSCPNPNNFTMTTLILRCHDNVRESLILPAPIHDDDEDYAKLWFQTFLEDRRKDCGVDFRRVPYETCAKLVFECLLRMEDQKQVLPDVEAETVVRLYGLSSTTNTTTTVDEPLAHQLPTPLPAPSVHDLWMVLQRPEYYSFHTSEDVVAYFQQQQQLHTTIDITEIHPTTEDLFRQGMRYVSSDAHRRERMYATLRHMALYHAVGGETQIASWLLWERAAMMNYSSSTNDKTDAEEKVSAAVTAMESNVLFQLLVNRFFDTATNRFSNNRNKFPNQGEWGKRITHHLMQRDEYLSNRGTAITTTLPPHIILTASTGGEKNNNNSSVQQHAQQYASVVVDWSQRACAICGSTTSKDTNGCGGGENSLLSCSQCQSVAYCCQDHQKLHWKRGGHKQDCTRRMKRNKVV